MAEDPLRLLLHGCKGSSVRKFRSKPLSKPTARPVTLAPSLDFFGNNPTTLTALPTQSAVQTSPKPSSKPSAAALAELSAAVSDALLESALISIGITTPTPVQRRVIPAVRAGNDVVAVAPTGSGKTLAYALPILSVLRTCARPTTANSPRALILAPTRELTAQIGRVLTRLVAVAKLSMRVKVVLSKSVVAGLKAAGEGGAVDIIVGTPLRLKEIVEGGTVGLGFVRHVVLDEADELLDEKFFEQVDGVLAGCGAQLAESGARVHMFSATLSAEVEMVSGMMMKKRKKVVVDGGVFGGAAAVGGVAERIEQTFTFVGGRGEQGKIFAVRGMLKGGGLKAPVLVFVQSKDRAKELFRELVYDGVRVDAIHSDRSQKARDSAVARFRAGEVWVLIATDVLARGLDFLGVNSVVNYDMPASGVAYVHRIGRTGRNGRQGVAVTLFTEEDAELLGPVLKIAKASGADVPEWAMKLRGSGRKDVAKRLEKRPPKRGRVGGPNRAVLTKRHRKEVSLETAAKEEGPGDEEDGDRDDLSGRKDERRRKKRRTKRNNVKPQTDVLLFDE